MNLKCRTVTLGAPLGGPVLLAQGPQPRLSSTVAPDEVISEESSSTQAPCLGLLGLSHWNVRKQDADSLELRDQATCHFDEEHEGSLKKSMETRAVSPHVPQIFRPHINEMDYTIYIFFFTDFFLLR